MISVKVDMDKLKSLADTKQLEERCDKLCEYVCEYGKQEAEERFHYAHRSGENDVTVSTESTDDGHYVVAEGKTVLFLEYGTGINTPLHTKPKYARGSYGNGLGNNEYWVYRGVTGDRGIDLGDGVVLTYGDPANECMYQTSNEMRDIVHRVAREVFKK